MAGVRIEWSGTEEMLANMDEYGRRVKLALVKVAQYWEPIIEAEAKENAPWTDRTANARQGLRAFHQELTEGSVILYLKHSISYGVYLELMYQGRYAIIMDTLEAHYGRIKAMLDGIFQ
jgi:hypothetical protein